MPNTMLQFNSLTKEYRDGFWRTRVLALRGISFSVPAGKIFGFLGANGAGKTTAIKVLLGLQSPTTGSVELFGKTAGNNELREKLGYLPERPYLHDYLSANEFLNFHRSLYVKKSGSRTNKELLTLVGLADTEKRELRTFSKGMLQRIGIAQALINDPDLIVLDEPMSGLDPVGRRDVRNLISLLGKAGKTIFFSSHILSDIESICEEIAFLEKGTLKYCGKVTELIRPSHKDFEILFYGGNSNFFGSHEFAAKHQEGDLYRIIVTGEQAIQKTLETIWANKGTVTQVSMVHKSLEEVLFGEQL